MALLQKRSRLTGRRRPEETRTKEENNGAGDRSLRFLVSLSSRRHPFPSFVSLLPTIFCDACIFSPACFLSIQSEPQGTSSETPPPPLDFFGGLSVPSNNFFKRHKPERCSYQRQWGVQVWVLLRVDGVFALEGRVGEDWGGVAKHRESLTAAPLEVERANIRVLIIKSIFKRHFRCQHRARSQTGF